MIHLEPSITTDLRTVDDLKGALQQAIMLEHSTIPAYLYALYSLTDKNAQIRYILQSVVVDEMLHMSMACNILNAIGGSPRIDDPAFIPHYPGCLPGSVESGLTVPLSRFSLDLVRQVFMEIEEPENEPLELPVATLAGAHGVTIGDFYAAIKAGLSALGNGIFVGNPARQLTAGGFPSSGPIRVTDVDSASQAIDFIVQQGEGTSGSPLDPNGDLAHYYRFSAVSKLREEIPVSDAPRDAPVDRQVKPGLAIPFDDTMSGILPVISNPKTADYPARSKAREDCNAFNANYTKLLKILQLTFNGHPEQVNAAVKLMRTLRQQAVGMMSSDRLESGMTAGPSFEYDASIA